MVNYLGFEHYRRWDLSRDKKYAALRQNEALSRQHQGQGPDDGFLRRRTTRSAQDVQNLLTEYQYAAKGKIDVENIDPDRNLSRAKESSTNTRSSATRASSSSITKAGIKR